LTPGAGSVIVDGVSSSPEKTPNGNDNPPVAEPIDTAALLARIEVCIARSDLAAKESVRAREASEEALRLALDVKRASLRIASDQFELRTGFPPTWRRRIALACAAGGIGSIAGVVVAFLLRGIF